MKLRTTTRGYETICADGETPVSVHRLVAIALYGLENVSNNDVHHLNNVPWDNRPDNLEMLTRSDHMRQHRTEGNRPWTDKGLLNRLYWEEGKTIHEIAKLWGCSPRTVHRWMRKHDINRRDAGRSS